MIAPRERTPLIAEAGKGLTIGAQAVQIETASNDSVCCVVTIGYGKAYRQAIEPGHATVVAASYRLDGWIVQRIGNVVRLVKRPML